MSLLNEALEDLQRRAPSCEAPVALRPEGPGTTDAKGSTHPRRAGGWPTWTVLAIALTSFFVWTSSLHQVRSLWLATGESIPPAVSSAPGPAQRIEPARRNAAFVARPGQERTAPDAATVPGAETFPRGSSGAAAQVTGGEQMPPSGKAAVEPVVLAAAERPARRQTQRVTSHSDGAAEAAAEPRHAHELVATEEHELEVDLAIQQPKKASAEPSSPPASRPPEAGPSPDPAAEGPVGEAQKAAAPHDPEPTPALALRKARSRGGAVSPPASIPEEVPMPTGFDDGAVASLIARAEGALREGNTSAAVRAWREAMSARPRDPNLPKTAIEQLLALGALEEARGLVRDARTLGHRSHEWVGLEAQLAFQAGHTTLALEILRKWEGQEPRTAELWGLEGTLWTKLGGSHQAAAAYRQAITLQPYESRWWLGLAIAADAAGQTLGARAAYRRALGTGRLTGESHGYATDRLATLLEEHTEAVGAQP